MAMRTATRHVSRGQPAFDRQTPSPKPGAKSDAGQRSTAAKGRSRKELGSREPSENQVGSSGADSGRNNERRRESYNELYSPKSGSQSPRNGLQSPTSGLAEHRNYNVTQPVRAINPSTPIPFRTISLNASLPSRSWAAIASASTSQSPDSSSTSTGVAAQTNGSKSVTTPKASESEEADSQGSNEDTASLRAASLSPATTATSQATTPKPIIKRFTTPYWTDGVVLGPERKTESPIRDKLGRKVSVWALPEPVMQAYQEVAIDLNKLLREKVKDLILTGSRQRHCTVDCVMLGREGSKIRPVIFINCRRKDVQKETIRFIQESDWWPPFHARYPSFQLRGQDTPLRLIAFHPSAHPEYNEVYARQSPDAEYFECGVPVSFGLQGTEITAENPRATCGGYLTINGDDYGLTAGHALDEFSDEESDEDEDFVYYSDDSEDESRPSAKRFDSIQKVRSTPRLADLHIKDSLPVRKESIGKVQYKSSDYSGKSLDWALIALAKPKQNVFRNRFSLDKETYTNVQEGSILSLKKASSVLALTGSQGPIKGKLSLSPSFALFRNQVQFVEMLQVDLEAQLQPGDSGSWVVTTSGEFCGMIIATDTTGYVAHIIPASDLLEELSSLLEAQVELLSNASVKVAATQLAIPEVPTPQSESPETQSPPLAIVVTPESIPEGTEDPLSELTPALRNDDLLSISGAVSSSTSSSAPLTVSTTTTVSTASPPQEVKSSPPVHSWSVADFRSPLHMAAVSGDTRVLESLLRRGANINAVRGYFGTALQAASQEGSAVTVNFLLSKRADVNTRGGFYDTALQAAAAWGNVQAVKLLIAAGADVNAQGGFYGTALQAAAASLSSAESIMILLRDGARPNVIGGHFGSPLHAAVLSKKHDTVMILLRNGANVDMAANTPLGKCNALQAAVLIQDQPMERLLRALGAGAFWGTSEITEAAELPVVPKNAWTLVK